MKTTLGQDKSEHSQIDLIALEIRKAREAKGLSFSDLHRLSGISRTTLHDYESGRSKPGAREVVLLCEALEISPNRMLLGTETPNVKAGGVLLSLVSMARTKPEKALVLSAMLIPLVATVLTKVGSESLVALATMADETLRARDPETFFQLSKLVDELEKIDAKQFSQMSSDEQQKVVTEIQRRSGIPPAEKLS